MDANIDKLDIILKKLENLEHDITQIKKDLSTIKQQNDKMNNHVDFVNGVYQKVEAPLNFITSKYYNLIGVTETKILEVTNHQ